MQTLYRHCLVMPTLAATVFLSACAGTRVDRVRQNIQANAYVVPHTIAVVVENHSPPAAKEKDRAQQLADAAKASDALATELQQVLAGHRLRLVPTDAAADLIVKCDITEVTGGDAALRMLIGYGAGKARLDVDVTLLDPALPTGTLLSFHTKSTTGGMPGVASGLTSGKALQVGGAALGLPWAMKQGLDQELAQTTKDIDQQLGSYFALRNWPYPLTQQLADQEKPHRLW